MSVDSHPITTLTSLAFHLDRANVDTDQIIPARYLTTTERSGLGAHAFADWRSAPASPLDGFDPERQSILIAGPNFGCGSSREHAAWALYDLGVRAVLSEKLADIFKANALKNGLLAIEVSAEASAAAIAAAARGRSITIDLNVCTLHIGEDAFPFTIDAFARRCLLDGVDQLGFLLSRDEAITAFEAARQ